MPLTRNPITNHVRAIRRAFTAIDRAVGRVAAIAKRDERRVSSGQTPKRKLKLSARRRAALKLQGRYLGYMRQLKPRQKAQVKAVRENKGMRAAIAVAKRTKAR